MQSDDLQQRLEAMEVRLREAEAKLQQREIETAYLYIHSNWTLIRWYLVREQDLHGVGSDVYQRSSTAEITIRDNLPRNLRQVQFAPKPMEVAYQWRIETTKTLNENRYTFFD